MFKFCVDCCNNIDVTTEDPQYNVLYSGGIKLRRQHWCFLALVLVVLIICLGVLLPNSAAIVNLSKEEQKNLVAQILTEVPLIDG